MSGSRSSIATAHTAGSPRPDSRQVVPASCETSSGGFASTAATMVEPDCAAATTRGRLSGGAGAAVELLVGLDLLRLEVDGEHAVDGVDERDHPASMSRDDGVARRAAAAGGSPPARAAT